MNPTRPGVDHVPRFLSLGLLTTMLACRPTTRYRQTLFTAPAAPPPHLGQPMEPGRVAVGGSAAGYMLGSPGPGSVANALLPSPGDPGLLLPPVTLGGHARAGVMPNTEIGVSALYAGPEQALPSSVGVLPLMTHSRSSG